MTNQVKRGSEFNPEGANTLAQGIVSVYLIIKVTDF